MKKIISDVTRPSSLPFVHKNLLFTVCSLQRNIPIQRQIRRTIAIADTITMRIVLSDIARPSLPLSDGGAIGHGDKYT